MRTATRNGKWRSPRKNFSAVFCSTFCRAGLFESDISDSSRTATAPNPSPAAANSSTPFHNNSRQPSSSSPRGMVLGRAPDAQARWLSSKDSPLNKSASDELSGNPLSIRPERYPCPAIREPLPARTGDVCSAATETGRAVHPARSTSTESAWTKHPERVMPTNRLVSSTHPQYQNRIELP